MGDRMAKARARIYDTDSHRWEGELMNYIEEYRALHRQLENYAVGARTVRGTANGWRQDTTEEKWRYVERRLAKLKDYFERHGIVVTA